MSELTIKVQAPDLVAALAALANALTGAPLVVQNSTNAPAQLPPPQTPAAPIAAPAPTAPPAAPVQPQAPAAPPAPTPPAVTPTAPPVVPTGAAPTYSRDQIMAAGAALIDAGESSTQNCTINCRTVCVALPLSI